MVHLSAQQTTVLYEVSTNEQKRPTFAQTLANATNMAALNAVSQPLDADLTAIAALATTANGRSLLTATGLTNAGLGLTNGAAIDALGAVAANGFLTRTAANTYTARTLTGTAAEITVTNGDGVAGAPVLSLPTALTFTGKTVTGGTFASPTLTTPALGVATATSINGNFFTTGSSTYTGTAGQTYTFPTTTATIARTDTGQTFTGTNVIGGISFASNAATSLNSVTSAALSNLTLGTGTFGTAVTFASATGAVTLASTTASTSTTTGSLVTAGGLGVAGAGWFGGTVHSGSAANAFTVDTNNVTGLNMKSVSSTVGMGLNASDQLVFNFGGIYPAAYQFYTSVGTGLSVAPSTVNVGYTTEATTGGAGSLTTAGGIYAAKKIIANTELVAGTTLTTAGGTYLHITSSALTDGAGASVGTLTNAPAVGNPTKWIAINDNGTSRKIPAW